MNIDLANVPPVPIQIGVAGENAFRTITFDASTWGADFPDATYTVVYKRSDGYIYPVLVNAAADAIVWSPTDTDTAVSGNGQIEVRLLDGETIGKTIVMQTFVAPSLSGDESEPSTPAPDWVNDVAADADRAEDAVSHYPKIVNGVWFVWDATQSEFVSTGISAQGEDGVSPTVAVTEIDGGHRVTITDADGAHTFDVMDGEDGEGGGSANAVLYTAQSLTESQKAQARTNVGAGTYSKPASGIPKSDLASAVQTSLGKADTALQTAPVTSVNNKTGAVTVKTPYYLTVTTENDTVYVDKTPAEIDALSAAGYDVHIRYPYEGEVLDARFNTLIETEALFGVAAGVAILSVFVLADRTVSSYVLDIQNELSQKADKSDIPAMATAPNMSDWTSGKTVDAATMKTVTTAAGLRVAALEDDVSALERDKANASDIPTAVSELTNDSGYQTATQVQTAVSGKADKVSRVAMTAQDEVVTIQPNKLYVFPEMSALTITLAAITDNSIVNEYHFIFDSGATATVLTLPASVLQPDGFTVEANMHYEISILEGAMTAQGWAVTA